MALLWLFFHAVLLNILFIVNEHNVIHIPSFIHSLVQLQLKPRPSINATQLIRDIADIMEVCRNEVCPFEPILHQPGGVFSPDSSIK